VFLLAALAAAQTAAPDPPSRVVRLNYLDGPVSYRPGGEEQWADASLNFPLSAGDSIWSDKDARAEMQVGSTAIRVGGMSGFTLLDLQDNVIQIRLSEGTLSLRVRSLAPDEVIEVDTLNAALTITAPGEYRFIVTPDDNETLAAVRSGSLDARYGAQVNLARGQMLRVMGAENPASEMLYAPPVDEWDQWCRARDQGADNSPSLRYVSAEMTGYQDLDRYGQWDDRTPYGAVWYPTSVAAGWAPYRHGRWAWVEPWGWTWVDEAPWGFAPFHYGRWTLIRGRWGWVPGRMGRPVYAPALVAFVGGAGGSITISSGPHVGWFPLGPGELYRPAYHHSSVYLGYVNHAHVVDVVRYREAPYMHHRTYAAITVVPQGVFVGAAPVYTRIVVVNERHLMGTRVIGATALLAPRRESVFGHPAGFRPRVAPPVRMDRVVVVTRRTPPPPRVSFVSREPMLRAAPGRPPDRRAVESIRMREAPRSSPMVRTVADQGGRPPSVDHNRPTGYRTPARPADAGRPAQVERGGFGNRPAERQPAERMNRPAEQPRSPDRAAPAGHRPPSAERSAPAERGSRPMEASRPSSPQRPAERGGFGSREQRQPEPRATPQARPPAAPERQPAERQRIDRPAETRRERAPERSGAGSQEQRPQTHPPAQQAKPQTQQQAPSSGAQRQRPSGSQSEGQSRRPERRSKPSEQKQ
jgi:hypothetical protein